jgi:hypothetical protein
MTPAKLAGTGFSCERSSEQTLAEAIAALPDRVRFGRLAVGRSALRRGAVGVALAALAAAVVRGGRLRQAFW